ncbi:Hypothetical predicted protein, partial [Marmota monax]
VNSQLRKLSPRGSRGRLPIALLTCVGQYYVGLSPMGRGKVGNLVPGRWRFNLGMPQLNSKNVESRWRQSAFSPGCL